MNNEEYLICSYFTVGFASILLGTLAYVLLKNSLSQTLANLVDSGFARSVNRFFVYGVIFPAFAGFASVSYESCTVDTYEKVIKNKTYLMDKNVEQLHNIFLYLIISLLIWATIVAICLAVCEHRKLTGIVRNEDLAN